MKPRHPFHPAGPGFSLLEILLVLAILALSVRLVVPLFRDTDAAKLRAAANLLISDLGYAQAESIAHSDNVRQIVFNTARNSYMLVTVATPQTPLTNPFDKQPYQIVFGQGRAAALTGVTLSAIALGGANNYLRFGLYGQTTLTSPGAISLTCGGRGIVVTVDPTTGEATAGTIQ